MARKAVLYLFYALISFGILTGCSRQPAQEMNEVKSLIDAAVQAGGEKYAQEEMTRIQERYAEALAEVKAQDAKFFKSYDKAKAMLTALKTDAAELQKTISARKEEGKKNALKELDTARGAVNEAKALLAKAPKTKATKKEIENLTKELKGLESSLPKVQESIDRGDYAGASDKAKTIATDAARISEKIKKLTHKPQPATKKKTTAKRR